MTPMEKKIEAGLCAREGCAEKSGHNMLMCYDDWTGLSTAARRRVNDAFTRYRKARRSPVGQKGLDELLAAGKQLRDAQEQAVDEAGVKP